MTTILSDENEKIYAYCEWWVTNGRNEFGGEYLYVRELWIHPEYRNTGAIKELIKKINNNQFSKSCHSVLWERGDKVCGPFKKEKLLRRSLWVAANNQHQHK